MSVSDEAGRKSLINQVRVISRRWQRTSADEIAELESRMRERIYGERRVVERVSDDLDAQRALAPEGFAITMRHEAGATVLALLGELDLAAAPRVRDALDRIEQERPAHLVIDLSRLCFIDSSGIHLIVDAHRRLLAGRRSTLEIRPGSPAVQRIFQLTGLEEELPFADGG